MLERTFAELCDRLADLRSSLRAVQVAAAQDELLSGELQELVRTLDGVTAAAQKARHASRLPVDVDAVRRALPGCQRELSGLKVRFCAGVSAAETMEAHRAEGRAELAWHIGRCSPPLFAAERAIASCWTALGKYALSHPGGAIPGFLPPSL
jgi:hypothetical protein